MRNISSLDPENVNEYLYKTQNAVFDFSLKTSFVSCEMNGLNNCLRNESEFIEKFRKLMIDVDAMSLQPISQLNYSGGFRHCHNIAGREQEAVNIIKKLGEKCDYSEQKIEQMIGGEMIFQFGNHTEIRIFGFIQGNVIKVLFIDWFHDFSYDERQNERNKKLYSYSVM